ncbi:M24 family metallopeptidase [Edaphobacillus lindanitolerans]|uniref:Xaa-Pro dipeptidase n=1 Tax=Edaphobacillus lindanitolerans TaxID=550447 RepID=A0A1U7PNB0_9BACI|nr:Xaa-Pro peptidase family protein [Edaphobacillus lindanitolerans]SIT72819.1 Xaa-Pro dipeptidase [Edaphobacillus lindanitolerans]
MNTDKRVQKLREVMDARGIDVSVICNFENQYYFSGLKAITYSRPIVLLVDKQETSLIIPSLEEEHAKAKTRVDHLHVYHEVKSKAGQGESYTEHFDALLSRYPKGTVIGAEFASFPVRLEQIARKHGADLVSIDKEIVDMRAVKDEQEMGMIAESGRLVSLALKHSLEHAAAGMSEMEMDQFGTRALFMEVAEKHPDATLDYFVMSPSGIERTNMPHVFSNTRQLKQQDIIIHSRQVGLNGYRAECERTFFIGGATEKQKEVFKVAQEAQAAALDFIKVGVTAKEVNEVARKVIEKAGLETFVNHRTGHGIGIGLHEEPSLRYDNDLVLKPGMAFCVEPGIYIPEVGGFRHSDTVILRENGTELITEYPRGLDALVFGGVKQEV